MKQTLAMKQTSKDRLRDEPAALAALAVFVLSAATFGGAWYFQLVLKILPCPLCQDQRISYYVIIPLSLLMVIAALMRAPPKLLTVGSILIIVAGLGNALLGTYHAGVEWHLWAGPTDCSGPLTNLKAVGSLLDQLHSVSIVRCDEASWRLLGISLAGYNVFISLGLAGIAAFALLARKRTD